MASGSLGAQCCEGDLFRRIALFLIVPALLAAGFAHAGTLAGKVVGVADGDTVTVLTDEHRSVEVRVVGVDAPERR